MTVTHGTSTVTDQGQPGIALTFTLYPPPAAPTDWENGGSRPTKPHDVIRNAESLTSEVVPAVSLTRT